jgi:hypothetical protein
MKMADMILHSRVESAVFILSYWLGGVLAMLIGLAAISQNVTEITLLSITMCIGGVFAFIGGVSLVFMSADIANKAVNLLEGK